MRNRYAVRMACAAVAGLGLVAAGLTGFPGAARAGAAAPAGAVPGGTISTVAGGVGGPGPARSVAMFPCGLKTARTWLYIGTYDAMRRVNELTGALTAVAGNNTPGPVVNGGVATATPLNEEIGQRCGAAVDPNGNLAITLNQLVVVAAARTGRFYGQKMTAGHIYTVAGNPRNSRIPDIASRFNGGPTGDGGPATKAYLGFASDVAFDRSGNMLIADSGLQTSFPDEKQVGALLRVVAVRTGTFYGVRMKAGDIYSLAGKDVGPAPAGTGGPAAKAWLGPVLPSAELDQHGNIILAGAYETGVNTNQNAAILAPYVQVIARATGTFYGRKMTAGRIYRVAGNGTDAGPYRNGVPGTKTSLWEAGGVLADFGGNIVIGDGPEVRVVAGRTGRFYRQNMRVGNIYRIGGLPSGGHGGDGGPALRAALTADSVGLDGFGNVLFEGGFNYQVRAIAARTGRFYGQRMTTGDIYTVAGNVDPLQSGDGGPPLAAKLRSPTGVVVSARGDIASTGYGYNITLQVIPARSGTLFGRKMAAGTLYMVPARSDEWLISGDAPLAFDARGNVVVTTSGAVSSHVWVVAARTGTFYGQQMTAGRTYRIAGGGNGFSGDGGPALKARLNGRGTAVDHHGNVVVVDTYNARLRVIAAAAGTFYGQKMTAGDIYTVAGDGSFTYSGDGGPARAAGIEPDAVAVDAAGNLILTDGSRRVRVVAAATGTFYGQAMTAGDIYTIAGNGTPGFAGQGGPATSAEFNAANGVAVDRHGNVIFTDQIDHVTWAVAAQTGTRYGQAMTAGRIYVVAGGGTRILGDGGPATKAMFGFDSPVNVAVSATGSLLITDDADQRIRAVTP
jgi:hypothetical protein